MAALDTRQRFQLSYWDSAIIEASRAMGCAEVLSEDLGDGQDYAGVRVINPFRSAESAEPVSLTRPGSVLVPPGSRRSRPSTHAPQPFGRMILTCYL